MRKYETIFVIDSLLKSDEIDSIINKYERFISANGGRIDAIERWGKKRLAYEIKKRQYGYYVLIRFDGPPTMIKPLEREYRLNESLLRFKTLVMPKAALKHLADTTPEPPVENKAPQAAAKTDPTPETEKPPTTTVEQEQVPSTEEAAEEAPAAAEEAAGAPETTTPEVEPAETAAEEAPAAVEETSPAPEENETEAKAEAPEETETEEKEEK